MGWIRGLGIALAGFAYSLVVRIGSGPMLQISSSGRGPLMNLPGSPSSL